MPYLRNRKADSEYCSLQLDWSAEAHDHKAVNSTLDVHPCVQTGPSFQCSVVWCTGKSSGRLVCAKSNVPPKYANDRSINHKQASPSGSWALLLYSVSVSATVSLSVSCSWSILMWKEYMLSPSSADLLMVLLFGSLFLSADWRQCKWKFLIQIPHYALPVVHWPWS